jgi:4-amino-4-deoxy-L-arabinose transferase-like glycosyltransferase
MGKMSLRNEAVSATVSPTPDALRIDRPIVAILFFSFAIRVACAIWFSGMIHKEGGEYARIAQNLMAGVGYVGMATPGEQLFFPPLFPFLILAVTPLTGDAEIAGRIVSIVFGSLVVVPVYLIAQRMYGERVAIGVAALVGIHPFLVEYSTSVYSEPTYLTLILTSIYMSMRAMDNPTLKALFLTGAFYGLAYLVRTEASAYMLVACTLLALRIMFSGAQHRVPLFRRLPVMVLGFLLFAGPYIAWLSVQAGQFRVENKTSFNLPTERLMQHGMSGYEASFGVEPDLTMRGIWWQSSVSAIKTYNIKIGELPSLLSTRAKTVAKDASAVIGGSLAIGSPALFGLAILGLFSRTWTAKLAFDQVHLGIVLALVPFAMLFTSTEEIRYYIIFVPVLCLWGTYGVILFSRWARKSAVTAGLYHVRPGKIETASRVLAVSAILLPSAIVSISQLNAARAERPFKEALANLAAGHPGLIRIASNATSLTFEARAEHVWLPYCDDHTARLFLTKAGVTHVVLSDGYVATPYQKKWMEEGVPKAHLIVNLSSKIGTRLKIYELDS